VQVVFGLGSCAHRPQLDVALLGDRCDTGGPAAAEGDQHVFDRGGAVVFGGEGPRMIDVIGELRLVLLRLAEAVERVRRWTSCGCRRSTKPLSAI
jgi:hypothetical protein